MHTGRVEAEGASLYYEVRGSGPALVMISGAGGDAGYYSAAAEALADAFTVITYDRRGNSRSSGGAATMSVLEQAADTRVLIDSLAGGRALVFGNSGGGVIGLALAAAYPEAVGGLIVHEPPIVNLLPEGARWQAFFRALVTAYAEEGPEIAAGRFVQAIRGAAAFPWPPDVQERFGGNLEQLFLREFAPFAEFVPDEVALAAASFPIVLAGGALDRGLFYALPSVVLAERLGVTWIEFPGHHLVFMEEPLVFAAALRVVATSMVSGASGVPAQWRGASDEPVLDVSGAGVTR